MTVPPEIGLLLGGTLISLQGWMLLRIVALEKKVTALRVRLDEHLHRQSSDTDHILKK
jgi:hypothetical protein